MTFEEYTAWNTPLDVLPCSPEYWSQAEYDARYQMLKGRLGWKAIERQVVHPEPPQWLIAIGKVAMLFSGFTRDYACGISRESY